MKNAVFTKITEIDRTLHEPARLAILSVLYTHGDADFNYLQGLLGLTNGNLNSHLAKLEKAGLIQVAKTFVGKRPHTNYWLSHRGKTLFNQYLDTIEQLIIRCRPK